MLVIEIAEALMPKESATVALKDAKTFTPRKDMRPKEKSVYGTK